MSKTLLTTSDVPMYIRDIVKRLSPCLVDYEDEAGNWWGYTFKLTAKWKIGYESQLVSDTEKLIEWAQRYYAHAKIVRYDWWDDYIQKPSEYSCKGDRSHRRKAYREGFHNHAIIVISDPVANRFEKDNYYKDIK